jgi:putative photosynthetic complex assembly protein
MSTLPQPLPKARPLSPVALLGAMALSTLVLVAAARWSGAPVEVFDSPVTSSRALRFEDTAHGAVAVLDAQSGREVARFEGEQGFVRGVLRAMARARKARAVDRHAPLLLQGHADGSLTLDDAATGERIHLESFGPTQRAAFAALQFPAHPVPAVPTAPTTHNTAGSTATPTPQQGDKP